MYINNEWIDILWKMFIYKKNDMKVEAPRILSVYVAIDKSME